MRRRRTARPAAAQRERLDDVLVTLLRQTQQLNERLSRLENRFGSAETEPLDQPSADDLLELRLHSARLAAELSRVTVELRAEIDELARRIGPDEPSAAPSEPDLGPEVDARDGPVIDLTVRRARRTPGWRRLDTGELDDDFDDE